MKNKKYRAFLVTPAFVEARKRKTEHDFSYGRIIPVAEQFRAEKILSRRPVTTSSINKNVGEGEDTKLANVRVNSRGTVLSAPNSSKSYRDTMKTDKGSPPGSHFQLWKIPERIVSADIASRKDISGDLNERSTLVAKTTKISTEKEGNDPLGNLNWKTSSRQSQRSRENSLPEIESRKKSPVLGNAEEVLQKETHELAKEWLKKSDKQDKRIAETFLKAISTDVKETNECIPKRTDLSRDRKASISSERSCSSSRSSQSSKSIGSNCIHRTSSVAWRRDSGWLKPTKVFHQTWHGLKIQPVSNDTLNLSSIYMRPHKKLDPCFIIHPEWGCKV